MSISQYSNTALIPATDWQAPHAQSPLEATVHLPGSKSLTNRELILSALAFSPSRLCAPLHSRDTELMANALRLLGATITPAKNTGNSGEDWLITPAKTFRAESTIDCGLAGTVMRFVPPIAGLVQGLTLFDGDTGAQKRPMAPLISALRSLGVEITHSAKQALPFTVHGAGHISGGEVALDASLSSQFVSGLLLAGARFDHGIHLQHNGTVLPSEPHIQMTLETLANRGVTVHHPRHGEWHIEPTEIQARAVQIEPDLSNAAPFLAAALVAGGSVTVPNWPEKTSQVGAQLQNILPMFGAEVLYENGAITVTGGTSIRGVQLDLRAGGELAPVLTALAALADSPSDISGIGHIRHHETDRLSALCAEINRLGGAVTQSDDGLHIEPRPLRGGLWQSYHDHRMAHAGALIGLAVEGVVVENIATTNKTLPQFPKLWRSLVAETVSADTPRKTIR